MEKEIFKIMCQLLNMGYELHLTKNSIKITEIFKSISREKYTEKDIFDCYGSLRYFEDGTFRITKEKFSKILEEINKSNNK